MNILTLIGAAAVCEQFADLLFNNPAKAAQLLGLVLTQGDLKQLEEVFNGERKSEIFQQLKQLRGLICHHPPCTLTPVIPGLEDFCKQAA